jgi:hypothetical protein
VWLIAILPLQAVSPHTVSPHTVTPHTVTPHSVQVAPGAHGDVSVVMVDGREPLGD